MWWAKQTCRRRDWNPIINISSMSDSMLDVMRKDMDGQLIRKKAVEKYSKNRVSEKIIDNYLLCTN